MRDYNNHLSKAELFESSCCQGSECDENGEITTRPKRSRESSAHGIMAIYDVDGTRKLRLRASIDN